MSREGEVRRLLRLRGWGRKDGIHGREVARTRPVAPRAKVSAADRVEGMRRAAALYLTSRECVARDVAFLLLPGETDAPDEGKGGARRCVGDLMVFTRESVFMVGFALYGRVRARQAATRAGVGAHGRPARRPGPDLSHNPGRNPRPCGRTTGAPYRWRQWRRILTVRPEKYRRGNRPSETRENA